jgi:hypothetical protein
MTPDAKARMDVYQEGQRAYRSRATCPYVDWRKGTWGKGFEAAKAHYATCVAEAEAADALERLTAGDVEFPSHPGPMIMRWTTLETDAIIDYGNRRAAAAVLAERERCALIAAPKNLRPCDCTNCDCGNSTDARMVAEWDEAAAISIAIRKGTP